MNAIADFFQQLFGPVVGLMGTVLQYFHYQLGIPWWLSIVFLTIIVRSLLFPLTVKQVRSMRAMQDLKPEMDKIRAQFKDNRQRQQEETMKLYQERKINPLGGCLPLLVQMPVFIGIFYVIRKFGGGVAGAEGTEPSFTSGGILWFQDLSHMDSYHVLPIVSALTMLAATEITSKNVEPQQRWMMRLLPLGITIFLWSFPAGLFVYWITSNLITFVQNYLIYNYGPGRKTSESGKNSTSSNNKIDSRKRVVDEPGDALGNDGHQETTGLDAEATAAKTAKRKRRKKKK